MEAHGPVETGFLKAWVMEAEDLALLLISHRILGKYLITQNFCFLTHNMGVISIAAFVGSKQVRVCEVLSALVCTKECLNNYFHFYHP